MIENKENNKKGDTKVVDINKPVEESLNIDVIAADDPDGYAAKLTPEGRNLIIAYLNTRPMAQVESFFVAMFDIEDKDPFFNVVWIKKLFDYLKEVCPRGESKSIIQGLADNVMMYKKDKKEEKVEEKVVPGEAVTKK